MANDDVFTPGELALLQAIVRKETALRAFLAEQQIGDAAGPHAWLAYLIRIKDTLGNISNDIGFFATLLIKDYLRERFDIRGFDAGAKPQGAPGIDVEARTADGLVVVGELKTTKPYQPGFGAQQRTQILKDLDRLQKTPADHRIMFVTDPDAYQTLLGGFFAVRAPDIEVVDIVTRRSSRAEPAVQHYT
jgi:hypothetical protein